MKMICKLIQLICPYGELAGRIALVALFLSGGFNKLGAGYDGTQGFMISHGVSGELLPLVIALEIGGALAVIVGWQTRFFALALAIFTVLTAVLFHADFGNLFLKNIAIAGGLLVLCHAGAGRFSIDHMLATRR